MELDYQTNIRTPISKQLNEIGFDNNLQDISSPWVGMNVLSLDQNTVVVDERQKQLIKKLEEYKFNVVTARMRHMYTMGGGLHCATLDTVRESKLESYNLKQKLRLLTFVRRGNLLWQPARMGGSSRTRLLWRVDQSELLYQYL